MPKKKEYQRIEKWLSKNKVQDVEIIVSDFAGISRGKKLPVKKFVKALAAKDLKLADSLFGMTVDCDFIVNEFITYLEVDTYLEPDFDTAGLVPWCETPTACFICDVYRANGDPLDFSPRQVLKNVLSLYEKKGWRAVVAPEFEFTLLAKGNEDDAIPSPSPPKGKSGRRTVDRGVLSIDGITEFGPLFKDVQLYCKALGLPMDALIQEAGVGQFEFNITHGDPLRIADHSAQFKRIMKWAAVKHGFLASFMAKPYPGDFGNAMHLHQSVLNVKTNKNIFADGKGKDTELFHGYIAGLQKYIPAAILFFAPYENSYLRLNTHLSCPVNTHWGVENRSVGFRVPESKGDARRVENRMAGSDTNPYLVMAVSLLCGYLGMTEKLKPSKPVTGSAYGLETNPLPRNIYASIEALEKCDALWKHLGKPFVTTFLDVKKAEIESRSKVLSPWDKKYLLTNV